MNWLRSKEVAAKLGLSATGLRMLQKRDDTFPKEIRVSERHVVYDEDSINEWMRSKMFTDIHGVQNESNGTQG